MKIRSFALLSVLSCLMAGGALAASLQDRIAELVELGDVASVTYADMDDDGRHEALLVPVVDGAPWRLLSDTPEGAIDIFEGTGRRPVFREIADGVNIVEAEGVRWGYDGKSVTPVYDLVRENISRITQPRSEEMVFLGREGFSEATPRLTEVLRVDILDVPGIEIIVAFPDDLWRDEDYSTPYLILSAAGDVLLRGRSIFHPAIYRHPDGGVTLIETTGEGMSLVRLVAPQQKPSE